MKTTTRKKPSAARGPRIGVAETAETARLRARLDQLVSLLHRRWAVPILAELHRGETAPGVGGGRFVTLLNRLKLSRESLRDTLDHLIALELVMRNPGYGHPLRPEYLLTPDRWNPPLREAIQPPALAGRGMDVAAACEPLMKLIRGLRVEEIAFRKWSLPVILAMGRGIERFGGLRSVLPDVTPRALTAALKDLIHANLVERVVEEGYPPRTLYRLTQEGGKLVPLIAALV